MLRDAAAAAFLELAMSNRRQFAAVIREAFADEWTLNLYSSFVFSVTRVMEARGHQFDQTGRKTNARRKRADKKRAAMNAIIQI